MVYAFQRFAADSASSMYHVIDLRRSELKNKPKRRNCLTSRKVRVATITHTLKIPKQAEKIAGRQTIFL